jgi:CDP-diacylglycerol--glycerol-3-phosphate 3-phosphatidyltransferase
MTLANKITIGRFFLSLVYFAVVLLAGRWTAWDWLVWDLATAVFLVTVVTDAVDGYYARKYKEVTNVGRIADPLVDKVVICGAFVLFLGHPAIAAVLPPWMVVVVLLREFVVSGLRSAAEAQGIAFGANVWGKIKMAIQSGAAVAAMVYAAHFIPFVWAKWVAVACMWIMLAATVISGITYLLEAKRVLSSK